MLLTEILLRSLLTQIEKNGHRYALLHQSLNLAEALKGDIDIVLDDNPQSIVLPILAQLQAQGKLRIAQCLHYEIPYGYYYIVEICDDEHRNFLHLDCLHDPIGVNRYKLTSDFLLKKTHVIDGYTTVAPEIELTYLLVKRSIKGHVDLPRILHLNLLLEKYGALVEPTLEQLFGASRHDIYRIPHEKSEESVNTILQKAGLFLERRYRRMHPLCFIRELYLSARRKLQRAFVPTGIFIVLLGPDGCGKSSVKSGLLLSLSRAFRKTFSFHWRPGLLPKLSKNTRQAVDSDDAAPPVEAKYGRVSSLVRFTYYLLDFIVGYWLVIYPKLAQSTLVIGERYYYDILVNPVRYGFNLPPWIIETGRKLVSSADILFLLSGDAASIHQRKPELSVDEIDRQIFNYRRLFSNLDHFQEINTDAGLNATVTEVANCILHLRSKKYSSSDSQWYAFPGKGQAKIWVNNLSTQKAALELYQPGSSAGKLVKKIASLHFSQYVPFLFHSCPNIQDLLTTHQASIRKNLSLPEAIVNFSSGTVSRHQKTTAQMWDKNKLSAYIKIAPRKIAHLLKNEAKALKALEKNTIDSFKYPNLIQLWEADGFVYLAASPPSEISFSCSRDAATLNNSFFSGMSEFESSTVAIATFFEDYDADILESDCHNDFLFITLYRQLRDTLTASSFFHDLQLCISHGDYTNWNTLELENNGFFVFDWEYFGLKTAHFDLIHSVYMPAMLIDRQSVTLNVENLLSMPSKEKYQKILSNVNTEKKCWPAYIGIYLLDIAQREIVSHGEISDYTANALKFLLYRLGHSKHCGKILVSAYACEPDKGSEPGVGWHWIEQIAKTHDVWVITKGNNADSIHQQLQQSPNPNLNFSYVELPKWARFWKKKGRGIHLYYYLWQFGALITAKSLHRQIQFDLAHHITFVNDWMWTFLSLLPIPYIWGPIGSNTKLPDALLRTPYARISDRVKQTVLYLLRHVDPLYWLSLYRSKTILVINEGIAQKSPFRYVARDKYQVHPAIGVEIFNEIRNSARRVDQPPSTFSPPQLKILFVGRFIPIKAPHLALDSFLRFSEAYNNCHLHMIGEGPELEPLESMVAQSGAQSLVTISKWMDRSAVLETMRQSDVLLFPSMEGAGMVVLEAMQAGLPVVCLDYGGPGAMVDDSSGIKVPIGDYESTCKSLVDGLMAMTDMPYRESMAQGAQAHVNNTFLWEEKNKYIKNLYSQTINKFDRPS